MSDATRRRASARWRRWVVSCVRRAPVTAAASVRPRTDASESPMIGVPNAPPATSSAPHATSLVAMGAATSGTPSRAMGSGPSSPPRVLAGRPVSIARPRTPYDIGRAATGAAWGASGESLARTTRPSGVRSQMPTSVAPSAIRTRRQASVRSGSRSPPRTASSASSATRSSSSLASDGSSRLSASDGMGIGRRRSKESRPSARGGIGGASCSAAVRKRWRSPTR